VAGLEMGTTMTTLNQLRLSLGLERPFARPGNGVRGRR